MAKNPSVSVIVPMYNVEKYIKFCVDSVLKQTFKDFEVILVDDASPDDCFKLCKKIYGDNKKVRIVRHKENLGLGAARNTGIKTSRGKYVYFLDSDDYLLPDALEKFFNAAEKNNADVVHAAGRYELVQNDNDPVGKGTLTLRWEGYSQEGFLRNDVKYRLDKHWKTYDTRSNAWLCFCRKDFLEKNQIEFLPIISEDEPFSFALFCFAKKYYILHEAFYVHLLRPGSIMRSFEAKRFKQGVESLLLVGEYVEKILDEKVPLTDDNAVWRDSFMMVLFSRFTNNHTAPYYNGEKIKFSVNNAVKKILQPFFGADEPFVRFFFNYFHFYQKRSKAVTLKAQQLAQQNKQLQTSMTMFIDKQPALLKFMATIKSDAKKIFLIGTPEHGNLGDQAIALGELRVLRNYFPTHEIVEIPRSFFFGEFGKAFMKLGWEKYVKRTDTIFLIGGGNFGNLWLNNEKLRRFIVKKFPENKIVVFPQSIHFTADDDGRAQLATSQKIYNAHKDLHIMTRDKNSFDFAQKFFPQVKSYLLPDAATVLHGITDDVDIDRKGVLFILRGDKEKVRDEEKIQSLQKYLAEKKIPFETADTVLNESITPDNREEKVRAMLMKIRASKLVITDRFHGVIFSFITRTPVLAFKSLDTKISSGIAWFKNLPMIFYAEDRTLADMQNFIDENYFAAAAEVETSDALNVKFDTDSREKFTRALNKIFGTNKNILPPAVRRIKLDAINIDKRRITYKYSVDGSLKKVFSGAEFYVSYNADISRTPKDIAVIPFLCNVLPIAWVFDAEIVVDELDNDFYEHLAEIKKGYVDMYPRIKFGGKLTVGKLIKHNYEVGDETATFFSGGADSFDTLIAHAEEHPTLITLFGADVKLSDIDGCNLVRQHARDIAAQFQCKNLLIASTFRRVLNEDLLSKYVQPLANDGWWHGFQHGIGIISHVAPYAYLQRLKQVYMASSFSREYTDYTCASNPTIDNHVRVGKCVTIHDGFDFNRQEKIRRICNYKRRTGKTIPLRVCWQSEGGKNCCACEKCYRTICGILAEGDNPVDYGFTTYTADTLEKMRADFQKPDFKYRSLTWQIIQARFRERPENLPKELAWLMEIKF